jgi:ABC-2 type transport system permease protein
MSTHLIMTLIKKDLTLFTRNQFYFIITIVGLVMYILMYFVMPKTMDETLKLGIYAPGMPAVENSIVSDRGIEAKSFDTLEELREVVLQNEYPVAIALPEDFMSKLSAAEKPIITVYFSSGDGNPELGKSY